jgi:proliferating cell nuclear antigen PCNA
MLFEIILPKEWFCVYEQTKSVSVGISSIILYRILSTREKSQSIEINYLEEEDHLSISFKSDDVKNEFDKYFNAPLIDLSSDMMTIPEIDNNIELTIESNVFAKLINQLKDFGDSLDLECDENVLKMSSKGSDSEKMAVDISVDNLESFSINEGSNLKLSFSLKYLQNICKYSKISPYIGLKMNDNHPMKIIYYLDKLEENIDDTKSKMVFYLAPKMDHDNDDDE